MDSGRAVLSRTVPPTVQDITHQAFLVRAERHCEGDDPRTDLAGDGDTDLADLVVFQATITGAR